MKHIRQKPDGWFVTVDGAVAHLTDEDGRVLSPISGAKETRRLLKIMQRRNPGHDVRLWGGHTLTQE